MTAGARGMPQRQTPATAAAKTPVPKKAAVPKTAGVPTAAAVPGKKAALRKVGAVPAADVPKKKGAVPKAAAPTGGTAAPAEKAVPEAVTDTPVRARPSSSVPVSGYTELYTTIAGEALTAEALTAQLRQMGALLSPDRSCPYSFEGKAEEVAAMESRHACPGDHSSGEKCGLRSCSFLGGGAFGAVYKGVYTDAQGVHMDAAYKVLTNKNAANREASIMRDLYPKENPCEFLVKLYDALVAPERAVLVMELCSMDLFNFIYSAYDGSIDCFVGQVATVMRDVAEGLAYMHDWNHVHCDLKPENIMLKEVDGDYRARVADFGGATFALHGDSYAECITYGYTPPEYYNVAYVAEYPTPAGDGRCGIKAPSHIAGDVFSYAVVGLLAFGVTFLPHVEGEEHAAPLRELCRALRLSALLADDGAPLGQYWQAMEKRCFASLPGQFEPGAVRGFMVRCLGPAAHRPSMVDVLKVFAEARNVCRKDERLGDGIDDELRERMLEVAQTNPELDAPEGDAGGADVIARYSTQQCEPIAEDYDTVPRPDYATAPAVASQPYELTLQDWVAEDGPKRLVDILDVLRDVARELKIMHEHEQPCIAHLDVQLKNVMVENDLGRTEAPVRLTGHRAQEAASVDAAANLPPEHYVAAYEDAEEYPGKAALREVELGEPPRRAPGVQYDVYAWGVLALELIAQQPLQAVPDRGPAVCYLRRALCLSEALLTDDGTSMIGQHWTTAVCPLMAGSDGQSDAGEQLRRTVAACLGPAARRPSLAKVLRTVYVARDKLQAEAQVGGWQDRVGRELMMSWRYLPGLIALSESSSSRLV
eukprot:TRINITY_DN19303_c0_g2_i1.p1 TRINITY_DN19303_c0_g2~~TRINITY_DN19303_c0_g2_i1.p1  ORF type:complete len:820 (+),score=222.24 TRINITY_DN19303_c0_g2_i1:54-2513(+)